MPDSPTKPALALDAPLTSAPGIGPRRAEALSALGIKNIAQLIAYLPARHERQEAEAPIAALQPDAIVSARGLVSATRIVAKKPRPRFEAVLLDDTGRLDLVWFNGLWLKDKIKPGMRLRVQGKARRFGPGIQIGNPQHWVLPVDEAEEPPAAEVRYRPVYPASEAISSKQIEQAIRGVLEPALANIQDHLPAAYRTKRQLLELTDAYRAMHAPRDEAHAAEGRRRLAYDELLLLQLAVQMKRAERLAKSAAPVLRSSPEIDKAIRARFPFPLTAAQSRVIQEISADLTKPVPANRLIQGDVGSGKTVVALYAMLLATATKHQAAIMAPTELLAEQHFAGISRMLEGSSVRIALLTGSLPAPERRALAKRIEAGEVDLVVGTHALLTETIRFHSLAVVIIDEQHRFGVHQRAALRTKGDDTSDRPMAPHTIVMTATPIPRTLALTLFGDLDVSTIDELPPGRKKIATRVVSTAARPEVYTFLRKRLDAGEQAYIVVSAIDADPDLLINPATEPGAPPPILRFRAVSEVAAELEAGPLKGKTIGQVHGRLSPQQRDRVMSAFRDGRLDALVATTVIEVGVDVPNSTVMVIEDAERFGLAQLHQLRGRVGRGKKSSACILIGAPTTDEGHARLASMAKLSDGFKLAERDLELRGFGDVVGLRQSGMPPFKVVDLSKDLDLLTLSRRDAESWIGKSPSLLAPAEALLRRRLLKAHGKWLGLVDVG